MNASCSIALEVAGPAAMFTRPDTGATPISYPVPTYSAVQGVIDAVLFRRNIYVRPTRLEICRPVRYERYVTNYGGPLRKPKQVSGKTNFQLIATILVDVHYRIHADVKEKRRTGRRKVEFAEEFKKEFSRRLQEGQTFYTPCLGWKEFTPSYFGPLQPDTKPDESVDLVIPSLLHSVWEHHRVSPSFRHDMRIEGGVMLYRD